MRITITAVRLLGDEVEVDFVDDADGCQQIVLPKKDAPRVGRVYAMDLHEVDNTDIGLYAPGTK